MHETEREGPARWPVIGHDAAVAALDRAVRRGQVSHAYLISGPAGVGRRALALAFARALLCQAVPHRRPCGSCPSCHRVERAMHPDLTVLSLQAVGGEREVRPTRISIDAIRELRATLALRPLESDWRVVVIDDADWLSRDAADALLKTLEEPPPFAVLILIVEDIASVAETIRSRCQQIRLGPVPVATVRAALESRGVGAPQAALIASLTRGRIGEAFRLAADPEELARHQELAEAGLQMLADPLVALGRARQLAESYRRGRRAQVEAQLAVLAMLWRDLLLLRYGLDDRVSYAGLRERLERLARRWSPDEIVQGLRATCQAMVDLETNVQVRLALDALVTQWPSPERTR
uniref:DNA polymerase III subunit delta n=1 Tax=Thermorudis peleae TaxID=1382356 RepID=A0A831TG48_9BACT